MFVYHQPAVWSCLTRCSYPHSFTAGIQLSPFPLFSQLHLRQGVFWAVMIHCLSLSSYGPVVFHSHSWVNLSARSGQRAPGVLVHGLSPGLSSGRGLGSSHLVLFSYRDSTSCLLTALAQWRRSQSSGLHIEWSDGWARLACHGE